MSEHYRAIYLKRRTVRELALKISEKAFASQAEISQVFYTTDAGLKVMVDDVFVQAIAEGQGMVVKVVDIPPFDANNTPSHTQCEVFLEY